MTELPLLDIVGLRRRYRRSGRTIAALDGVDLTIRRGEAMGLAGVSGSGKTTLARAVMRLIGPDAGAVRFDGIDLLALRGSRLRMLRPRLQMVFQEPMAAFNPRATVARILDDPLRIHRLVPRRDRREAMLGLLARVGLSPELIDRRPHEISGGQRQRVAIARAMATRPELIVLDEPASALDVSVRAQILNLMMDLQTETGVAYLLISHDLAVIRAVCDRVAVMDQGRIVELGEPDAVFRSPQATATRRLVEAVPRLVMRRNEAARESQREI